MCGITGVINWGDSEVLDRMTDVQVHRGPDDRGTWTARLPGQGFVGLGSRRLSIIDLSAAGHMPMSTPDGAYTIVFNGEIYNFPELRQELVAQGCRFRSHTDTEVVLHLYARRGAACLDKLNGMFAFAIWDAARQELFLARDHFGVKPLYYAQQGERFAFASEIKSLLLLPDFPRAVNAEALDRYLNFLWVPDPLTMFDGVLKLPAGHCATLRGSQLAITRYWDVSFPPRGAAYPQSEAELIEQTRTLFRRSVHQQMISDVPLGAFLSGGIDSSAIVAMMAERGGRVHTYNISFPERYRKGEPTLDDPRLARLVADKFGCDHREIVVEPEVTSLLPKLTWHMDEPTADPALIMAYLVCREAHGEVKVLLSGVGGDELFAGYRKHVAAGWMRHYQMLPRWLRRGLIEPVVLNLPTLRGTPVKGFVRLFKKMARSGSLPLHDAFLMNCTYLTEEMRHELYRSERRAQAEAFDAWAEHRRHFTRAAQADFLNQMLYVDLKAFMVSLNFTYNDKMSMASSIEARVPFLDRDLVEFAARQVPPRLKLKGTLRPTTKYLLKRAMQGILPEPVLRAKKAGFGAPVDWWIANDLREMIDDLLSAPRVRSRGFFNPEKVAQLLAEHRRGARDWSYQIWQLLTLELWMQAFLDVPAARPAAVAECCRAR